MEVDESLLPAGSLAPDGSLDPDAPELLPSPGQFLDRSLPDTSGVSLVPDAPLVVSVVVSLVPVAPLVPPIVSELPVVSEPPMVLPLVLVSPLPAGTHSVPLPPLVLPVSVPVPVPVPDEVPEVSPVEGIMPGGQTVVDAPVVPLLVVAASLVPVVVSVLVVPDVSLVPVVSVVPLAAAPEVSEVPVVSVAPVVSEAPDVAVSLSPLVDPGAVIVPEVMPEVPVASLWIRVASLSGVATPVPLSALPTPGGDVTDSLKPEVEPVASLVPPEVVAESDEVMLAPVEPVSPLVVSPAAKAMPELAIKARKNAADFLRMVILQ